MKVIIKKISTKKAIAMIQKPKINDFDLIIKKYEKKIVK
jgi:hypothetical protein